MMFGLEVYDIKNTKQPDLHIFTLYAQVVNGEIRYSASNIQEEHIKNLQKKTSRFETIIQDRTKPSKVLKPRRNLATLFSRLVGYDWFRLQDVYPHPAMKKRNNT
jgi:hypothetical protein